MRDDGFLIRQLASRPGNQRWSVGDDRKNRCPDLFATRRVVAAGRGGGGKGIRKKGGMRSRLCTSFCPREVSLSLSLALSIFRSPPRRANPSTVLSPPCPFTRAASVGARGIRRGAFDLARKLCERTRASPRATRKNAAPIADSPRGLSYGRDCSARDQRGSIEKGKSRETENVAKALRRSPPPQEGRISCRGAIFGFRDRDNCECT